MKGRKPKHDAVRRGLSDAYGATDAALARGVAMPADIASDPVRSEIWAWIAPPGNSFEDADVPNLRLLCYWHAVAAQAQRVMLDPSGTGTVAILDQVGEKPYLKDGKPVKLWKRHPAVDVLKQASAEIRALSDQLGLSPLARSRIGLMQATAVKTAADTAAMFQSIDGAYGALD